MLLLEYGDEGRDAGFFIIISMLPRARCISTLCCEESQETAALGGPTVP